MTGRIHTEQILIDWGTTNLRAYLVTEDGDVVERREVPEGIMQVPDRRFEAALDRLVGDWRHEDSSRPVLLSGMVGSRQGWIEAPYVACPAGLDDIAAALIRVPAEGRVLLVPGLHWSDGRRDEVMRGEEVQVFGALREVSEATLCLPGTHSKWARVEGGRLVRFSTVMTGEIYASMRNHGILGRLMNGESDDETAFLSGIDRSAEAGGVMHHLFGVRTAGLFDRIAPEGLASYMSGIVVGHEVRDMLALHRPQGAITLVASGRMKKAYRRAFDRIGAAVEIIDGEAATIAGLSAVLAARL
jgi:2-dehydro-3-deoxygalactonokinase